MGNSTNIARDTSARTRLVVIPDEIQAAEECTASNRAYIIGIFANGLWGGHATTLGGWGGGGGGRRNQERFRGQRCEDGRERRRARRVPCAACSTGIWEPQH